MVSISAQVQFRNPIRFGQHVARLGPFDALGEWMYYQHTYTEWSSNKWHTSALNELLSNGTVTL